MSYTAPISSGSQEDYLLFKIFTKCFDEGVFTTNSGIIIDTFTRYCTVADEVIRGKYDVFPKRFDLLRVEGYDPDFAQVIVNFKVWKNPEEKEKNYEELQTKLSKEDFQSILDELAEKYSDVADEIIKGKYGNFPERFDQLRLEGYDPDFAQAVVNLKLWTPDVINPLL